MDLSKSFDTIEHTSSADVENVREAVSISDPPLDSREMPTRASWDANSELGTIQMSFDDSAAKSDVYLTNTDNLENVLVSHALVSDPVPSVETVDQVSTEPELLFKPIETETVCESEGSSEFSTTVVDDRTYYTAAVSAERSTLRVVSILSISHRFQIEKR